MPRYEKIPEFLKALPEADVPIPGVTGHLLQGETQQAVCVEFAETVEVPEHAHDEQWEFVVCGKVELRIGGETIVQVQGRGLAAVGRAEPGERVVFVSHGDIIRAILSHYLAVPLDEFRRIRVDNCGLSAIASRRGRAEVKFVNLLAEIMHPVKNTSETVGLFNILYYQMSIFNIVLN